MHHSRTLIAAAAVLIFSPATTFAEDDMAENCKDPVAADVVKCFSVDLSMPDSPGLLIVGLGTDNVVRPTTPRQFGAAVANSLNDEGKPTAGFSLDFAPYKLLQPATTRKSYVDSPWLLRPLWNTQFSTGIGKATDSTDKSLRVGYGLSTVLWRRKSSDPVLNETYQTCLKDRLDKLLETAAPPTGAGSSVGTDAGLAQCYANFAKSSWNSTALTIGYAESSISDDGDWSNRRSGASGNWVSFSYGFDDLPGTILQKRTELLLHWRELDDERVQDPDNSAVFVEKYTGLYGAVLRLHGERLNGYLEKSWARTRLSSRPADHVRKFAVGLEWKLTESSWIVVSFGGETGSAGTGNETSVRTGFKFGASDKPLFAGS